MPEPSAIEIFDSFDKKVKRLETLTENSIFLHRRGHMTQSSVDALFSSAAITLHANFETFLEDLFYSCITGRSGIDSCDPYITFKDRSQAEVVLFGNVSYATWLPFDKGTKKHSQRGFRTGEPFDRLRRHPTEQHSLETFTNLRNAAAHQSKYSLDKVSALTGAMRPRRRHVAGFLQHKEQGVTNYGNYTTNLRSIASAFSAPDLRSAKWNLSPETAYSSNNIPGKGHYECIGCAGRQTVRTNSSQLVKCSNCNTRRPQQLGWRRIYT